MSNASPDPKTVAFCPTEAMRQSADVPNPTVEDMKRAEMPVGLILCQLDMNGGSARAMRMYYVSKEAAALRNSVRVASQGAQLEPGWYACAVSGQLKIAVQTVTGAVQSAVAHQARIYVNGTQHCKTWNWEAGALRAGDHTWIETWDTPVLYEDGTMHDAREAIVIRPAKQFEPVVSPELGIVHLEFGTYERLAEHGKETLFARRAAVFPDGPERSSAPGEQLALARGNVSFVESTYSKVHTVGFAPVVNGSLGVHVWSFAQLRHHLVVDEHGNGLSASQVQALLKRSEERN